MTASVPIQQFEPFRPSSLKRLRRRIASDFGFLGDRFKALLENHRQNSERTARILLKAGEFRPIRILVTRIHVISDVYCS
jgi:hypothetical protein